MTISIAALNPDNYLRGQGKIYFMLAGAGGDILDYPVGNVTEFEVTPNLDTLDHFSRMTPTRSKDKSIITELGFSVRMVMEEWIPSNLRLMLMGLPDTSDLAAVTIGIGSQTSLKGRLLFVATNSIGPKWSFDFPEVEFKPSSSLSPLASGNDWEGMEVTGEILVQTDDDNPFGTATADFSEGAAVPTNTVPPTVYGTARVGFTLSALKGSWTGSPTIYGYQWQHFNVTWQDIVGKVSPTYLVEVAYLGEPLRVKVTATNSVGANAGTVASAATADVIAA